MKTHRSSFFRPYIFSCGEVRKVEDDVVQYMCTCDLPEFVGRSEILIAILFWLHVSPSWRDANHLPLRYPPLRDTLETSSVCAISFLCAGTRSALHPFHPMSSQAICTCFPISFLPYLSRSPLCTHYERTKSPTVSLRTSRDANKVHSRVSKLLVL